MKKHPTGGAGAADDRALRPWEEWLRIEVALVALLDKFRADRGTAPTRIAVPAVVARTMAEAHDADLSGLQAVRFHGVPVEVDPYLPPRFVLACGPEPQDVAMLVIHARQVPPNPQRPMSEELDLDTPQSPPA